MHVYVHVRASAYMYCFWGDVNSDLDMYLIATQKRDTPIDFLDLLAKPLREGVAFIRPVTLLTCYVLTALEVPVGMAAVKLAQYWWDNLLRLP